MKKLYAIMLKVLLASMLFAFSSCTVPKVEHIEINPTMTKAKQPVGNGMYMLIPSNYRSSQANELAPSFKSEDDASSIQAQVITLSVADLKKTFEPDQLKKEGVSLSETTTIQYGNYQNAFFAKVYDEKNGIFSYTLAIELEGQTYLLEATTTDIAHDFYDTRIRQSLLSVYIEASK